MIAEEIEYAACRQNYERRNAPRRRLLEGVAQALLLLSAAVLWYYTRDMIVPAVILLSLSLGRRIWRSDRKILELRLQLADAHRRHARERER